MCKNLGGRRAIVARSKAYANLSSVGSLQAGPKNEIPIESPRTNPAGTVICGYPATAARVEQLPDSGSPVTQSVNQAGPAVDATMASTRCSLITASIPSVRESLWFWRPHPGNPVRSEDPSSQHLS